MILLVEGTGENSKTLVKVSASMILLVEGTGENGKTLVKVRVKLGKLYSKVSGNCRSTVAKFKPHFIL